MKKLGLFKVGTLTVLSLLILFSLSVVNISDSPYNLFNVFIGIIEDFFMVISWVNIPQVGEVTDAIRFVCQENKTCILNQVFDYVYLNIPYRRDESNEIILYPEIVLSGGDCEDKAIFANSLLLSFNIGSKIKIGRCNLTDDNGTIGGMSFHAFNVINGNTVFDITMGVIGPEKEYRDVILGG